MFDTARNEREHTRQFRKFSKGSDQDNFVLTRLLANQPVRIAQVALHKPSMMGSFTRANHKEEYQYLCKFIIERISWIVRDSAAKMGLSDTKCELVFSAQQMYSYDDLCEYLDRIKAGRDRYNCSAEWQYVDETIRVIPHANEQPIHLADVVASALHKAIEPKKHGMTDDRFQRNLAPAVYRKNGTQYGVKLFPSKEIAAMKAAGHFGFLQFL